MKLSKSFEQNQFLWQRRSKHVSTMFFLIGSYCDCFAAGLPCLDSCKCQNCENTSANAPKVQDARKKIESRNPLAFAPKVTNEGTGFPANTMVIPQKDFSFKLYVVSLLLLYSNLMAETLCRKMGPC